MGEGAEARGATIEAESEARSGLNLTLDTQLGPQTVGIDPWLPFKIVPMKGRSAQIAAVARPRAEWVNSTRCCPCRSARYVR